MDKPKTSKNTLQMRENFVNEYIMTPNDAKGAALRAGYSENTVSKTSKSLLEHEYVQRRLKERRQEIQEKTDVTPEKILKEYAKIAFLDPKDYFSYTQDDGIQVKDSIGVDMTTIAKIKEQRSGKGKSGKNLIDIEFHDKTDALKSIRDMCGYDAPTKSANITAVTGIGEGQQVNRESIEAAILAQITGTPKAPPN